MSLYKEIHDHLLRIADPVLAERRTIFFKTGKGEYAEGDKFLGIIVPELRRMAKAYGKIDRESLILLLQSSFNEERLLGLFILVSQYNKGNAQTRQELFETYVDNLEHINNWNLVDSSAHLIVGAYLFDKDKTYLITLTQSPIMWHRRIAMVSTLFLIRKNQFDWTIKLAEMLICDDHDLIHKAVGWMLREIGEREEQVLRKFLDEHASYMPRTMLRYAIEKLPTNERLRYLTKSKS